MEKIIIIKKCYNCPHFRELVDQPKHCVNVSTKEWIRYFKDIDNIDKNIPDWCNLITLNR